MSTRYRYRSPRRWRRSWAPTKVRLVLPGRMLILSNPVGPDRFPELLAAYTQEHLHLYHPDPINFIPLVPS